jgi:hypothetical protein
MHLSFFDDQQAFFDILLLFFSSLQEERLLLFGLRLRLVLLILDLDDGVMIINNTKKILP